VEQARACFEQYLKSRHGQTTTPKCYLSDVDIFICTLGNCTTLE
jgi:hypothetical protein